MPVWIAAAALYAAGNTYLVTHPDRRDPNYYGHRHAVRVIAAAPRPRSKSHRLQVVRRAGK